jgi:hypothetical protein
LYKWALIESYNFEINNFTNINGHYGGNNNNGHRRDDNQRGEQGHGLRIDPRLESYDPINNEILNGNNSHNGHNGGNNNNGHNGGHNNNKDNGGNNSNGHNGANNKNQGTPTGGEGGEGIANYIALTSQIIKFRIITMVPMATTITTISMVTTMIMMVDKAMIMIMETTVAVAIIKEDLEVEVAKEAI